MKKRNLQVIKSQPSLEGIINSPNEKVYSLIDSGSLNLTENVPGSE